MFLNFVGLFFLKFVVAGGTFALCWFAPKTDTNPRVSWLFIPFSAISNVSHPLQFPLKM